MKKTLAGFIALLLLAGVAWAGDDRNHDRRNVQKFATLPNGVRFPEGITANPANGDIYVSTFDAPNPNNPDPHNKLLRYSRHGHLLAQRDFGTDPLLGMAFDRAHNKVYVATVGDFSGSGSRVQRIDANFDGSTTIESVADIPSDGAPANRIVDNPDGSHDTIMFEANARVPNALAFDSNGNLYVSDSFQGAIYRIANAASCGPCSATLFLQHPLLATAGFPPFGANGIAFNGDESALFIANTGDDRILRYDIASDETEVFAESVNGADGITFDAHGRLWVAANQADEVVALNEQGRVIARLGEFQGINRNGTPRGLLFPASLVIVGNQMFVTNLALPLTESEGDEPEEAVTRYTVSRFKLPHR